MRENNSNINEILTAVVGFYRNKYGEQLEQVWLFGSKARGNDTADSDVDVMVVVDDNAHINKTLGNDTDEYNFAMDILTKYDELISPKEYPLSDFNSNRISLHRNVKREGVLFYEKQ
jgi:predicted nucleotidyltransferase